MTTTETTTRTQTPARTAASMAAAALTATELVRRASPYVQAVLLAHLASRHPDEAREALEAAEDMQESIADVWAVTGIAEPGPGMSPAVAVPRAPDAITEAREAMETARAELSLAMDQPTPDAEVAELHDRAAAASDAWHVSLAVHGRYC